MAERRWWSSPMAGSITPADFRGKKNRHSANGQYAGYRLPGVVKGTRISKSLRPVATYWLSQPQIQISWGSSKAAAVDAVWTVEPWVTRLEKDANAKVFLEDKDVITTWLVSSVKFLNEHPDLAKKIATANEELTQWIKSHPAEAQNMLVAELKAETRTDVSADTVSRSLQRIQLTNEDLPALVQKAVKDGKETGFIKARRYFAVDPKPL